MDRQSLNVVFSQQEWSRDPLETPFPYYVLLETSGSDPEHDAEKLHRYFQTLTEEEFAADGTVAQNLQQARQLFSLREDITVALTSRGFVYKYDVSLPLERYYELVEVTRGRLSQFEDAEVVGYGHLGDGNLHLNVSTPAFDAGVLDSLEPFLFEWTSANGGSISAEHGIGQHKPRYMHMNNTPEALDVMRTLKCAFDPQHILNPYKVLPSPDQSP